MSAKLLFCQAGRCALPATKTVAYKSRETGLPCTINLCERHVREAQKGKLAVKPGYVEKRELKN